ncbi:phage tail protein [Acetobacter sicerae]|uniref:phage tail protein n=1 Tax=Acetobacter sicerae TaxID=85325 RepID=UPI00156B9268|nr:phage tail protein [Acetobacter sicerae]NHN93625.1 phage tail protein [Acetobacter sicerae]
MSVLSHTFGSDLDLDASGGLAVVDGATESQQSIMRRLFTNPGAYLWHLDYGAGLPQAIGRSITAAEIQGVVSAQMLEEDGVDQSQPVSTSVTGDAIGNYDCTITYTDAVTGTVQPLSFTL